VFAPINPYSLVYCLRVRGKPTRGDHVNSRVDSGLTGKQSNNLERPARSNTLAYSYGESVTKEKCFVTLTQILIL
jgi:hypothetical protein